VLGALEAARGERVLVLATDLPLVSDALLLALVAWPEADAVVPRAGEGRHALCALLSRERVRQVAKRRLAAGELSLHGLFGEVDTAWLEAGTSPGSRRPRAHEPEHAGRSRPHRAPAHGGGRVAPGPRACVPAPAPRMPIR
jgi:molybdopterin-guanine dinucleotide biosynthesis protein A